MHVAETLRARERSSPGTQERSSERKKPGRGGFVRKTAAELRLPVHTKGVILRAKLRG